MSCFYGKQCNCVGQCDCSKDDAADNPSLADIAEAERMRVKLMIIKDYQVESAFINVTKLARILGISASTIWRLIRNRQFFIPYQIFNFTPMVCIDDLVEWYCARDCLSALEAAETEAREKNEQEETAHARQMKEEVMARARAASIVEDAMATLGLAGNGKRGTGFRPGR
ncbi:helix-turn-helix transcriptional regulator [Janthinobacterium sp. MDT1-19]|uniref:helix-turn-helix transcriptional regulator n=1 Tax=Janthinobacterium sp. MDT1-19 TaxID=1259339 RepID=UPI003F23BD15